MTYLNELQQQKEVTIEAQGKYDDLLTEHEATQLELAITKREHERTLSETTRQQEILKDVLPAPILMKEEVSTPPHDANMFSMSVDRATFTSAVGGDSSPSQLPHMDLKEAYQCHKPPAPQGMCTRDLDKMARNISTFDPVLGGSNDTPWYLRQLEYHLRRHPEAQMDDKVYLLKATSSREVNSFIERQALEVQADYDLLILALKREFSNVDDDEHNLIAAMAIKQAKRESPQVYYHRMLKTYFGNMNEPGMEEDMSFKQLFVRNLHPATSLHLGIAADERTMTSLQLRELATRAFNKLKTPQSKSVEHHTVEAIGLDLQGVPTSHIPPVAITPSRLSYCKKSRSRSKRPNPPVDFESGKTRAGNQPNDWYEHQPSCDRPSPRDFGNNRTRQRSGNHHHRDASLRDRWRQRSSHNRDDRSREDDKPPFCQFLSDLTNNGNGQKIYLMTKLEDSVICDALVDSAADLTVMSSSLYDQLQRASCWNGRHLKIDQCEVNATDFIKNKVRFDQVILVELKIGPMLLIHPVYVSKMDTIPLLLGLDLLERFEALIDLKHLKIYAQVKEPLPIPHQRSQDVQYDILCVDIPAQRTIHDDALLDSAPKETSQALELWPPTEFIHDQEALLSSSGPSYSEGHCPLVVNGIDCQVAHIGDVKLDLCTEESAIILGLQVEEKICCTFTQPVGDKVSYTFSPLVGDMIGDTLSQPVGVSKMYLPLWSSPPKVEDKLSLVAYQSIISGGLKNPTFNWFQRKPFEWFKTLMGRAGISLVIK